MARGTKIIWEKKKVLEKVAERLNLPQPPEKKLAPLRLKKRLYPGGNIILYKLQAPEFKNTKWYGSYVSLKVIGFYKLYIGSLPRDKYYHIEDVVKIHNFHGKNKPSAEEINNNKMHNYEFTEFVLSLNKREVKKLNLELVKKATPTDKDEDFTNSSKSFININNIEYALIGDLMQYEKDKSIEL